MELKCLNPIHGAGHTGLGCRVASREPRSRKLREGVNGELSPLQDSTGALVPISFLCLSENPKRWI